MAVSYRTGVYILQFIFFVPALFLSLWLCVRHGKRGAATCWRFVVVLSMLRIASDISYFITLTHPSIGAYVADLICSLLGLAPLTLACVGLLQRVNEIPHLFPRLWFIAIGIVSLAGLATGIAGATLAVNENNSGQIIYSSNGIFEAALALFIVTFGLMVLTFFALTWHTHSRRDRRQALGREAYVLVGVGVAIPFLLIRLVYAAIADFSSNAAFAYFGGNTTIYLCMSVLTEIIVTACCLAVGFTVPPPEKV